MNHSTIAAFAHSLSQAATNQDMDRAVLKEKLRDILHEAGMSAYADDEEAVSELFSVLALPPDELAKRMQNALQDIPPAIL